MKPLSLVNIDSPFYKNTRMTDLQQHVFSNGRCPSCHNKNIYPAYAGGAIQSHTCDCGQIIFTDRVPNAELTGRGHEAEI